jgi:hypothetical protein
MLLATGTTAHPTRHPGRSAHAQRSHAQSRDLAARSGAIGKVPDSLRCAAASGMTGGAGVTRDAREWSGSERHHG